MSAMSEVVPLPSFGEVFFDARGQERVLRVTWHEGTLVLSLWRGEMCTASFRMPMENVGQLLETLENGYAEAGGEFVEEGPAPDDDVDYPEYPGTGQYVRPAQEDLSRHAVPGDQGVAYPSAGAPYQEAYQEEDTRHGAVPSLGPNDVLVARGTPAAPDKLVASHAGPQLEAVPRENLIVGDFLPYSQPPPLEPQGSGRGDAHYQLPSDPYGMPAETYGVPPQHPLDPAAHGASRHPADGLDQRDGLYQDYPSPPQQPPLGHDDRYDQPARLPAEAQDPYATQWQPPIERTDPYGMPPVDTPAGGDLPGRYDQQQGDQVDWYGTPQQPTVDPSDPLGLNGVTSRQQIPQPPATGEMYQQGDYRQDGYPLGDAYQRGDAYPQADTYRQGESYPPPDPYQQRDAYQQGGGYQQGDAYQPGESYPQGDYQQGDNYQQSGGYPGQYPHDPMYTTGERLRPDQQPPSSHPHQDEHDPRDRRDGRGDW